MNRQNLLVIFLLLILGVSSFFFVKIKQEELKDGKLGFALNPVDLLVDKEAVGGMGLEFGHAGRIWLNTADGYSKVYSGRGEVVKTKDESGNYIPLFVKVPNLTSIVFADSSDTNIFSKDAFIFVTSDGKIFGWHKLENGLEPLNATLRVDSSKNNSQYTGITMANKQGGNILYVADKVNNKVEMYDQKYNLITNKSFVDKSLGDNFIITNIKNINDLIYVIYTDKQNQSGVVNIFDLDGQLIKRLITGGHLSSPWGMTVVHDQFGTIGGKLLVGNTGDGKINIYEPTTGEYLGTVKNNLGDDLVIPGLQALTNGTNNGAGKVDELFFSSFDPDRDRGAVFGKLQIILNQNSSDKKQTGNKDLSAADELRANFLTGEFSKIDFEKFETNLNKDCLKNCLQEKLNKKFLELDATYKKLFDDAKVIQTEFQAHQKFTETNKKLNTFLAQLENLDPKKFKDFTENFCLVNANTFYAGNKLTEIKDECVLYKTTQWLNQLYSLRSQYIRVELGPLGVVAKNGEGIKTKTFKDLIDEEEARINKQY